MRGEVGFHLPALESAMAELERRGGRFEAFARSGTRRELRRVADGRWERSSVRETGVACRVARGGSAGFAAAAGSAPAAGREAARAALASLLPGPDPLPPLVALGRSPVPDAPPFFAPEQVEEFADRLAAALDKDRGNAEVLEVRVVAGGSTAAILTAEGFSARSTATATVVEVLIAHAVGGPRLFHVAARSLADLDAVAVATRAVEVTGLATRGGGPRRRLADVVLAPAAAAALLAALAELFTADRLPALSYLREPISPVWDLVDARCGPDGLLPQPSDGEGLPARAIPLLAAGRLGPGLATWSQAAATGIAPGGAVRGSYRAAPRAGAANLVMRAARPLPAPALLDCLGDGVYLALPLGSVQLDVQTGRFSLACTALEVRAGRPAGSHAGVELRGSVARLLRNLAATGGDSAGFSLSCAVTSPSLLFRGLEIA